MSRDGSDGGDDEVTIWAGRLRAWPTPVAPSSGTADADEATVLSARRAAPASAASAAEEDPDEATVAGSRRRAVPADSDDGTQLARRRRSTEPLPPGGAETPPAVVEQTAARTRRASTRGPIDAPSADGRRAHVPAPEEREVYRPRAGEPVHAVRAAPTPRAAQDPVDVAVADVARTRRGRRRLVAGVLVGAALVAAAIATAVGVLLLPA